MFESIIAKISAIPAIIDSTSKEIFTEENVEKMRQQILGFLSKENIDAMMEKMSQMLQSCRQWMTEILK